MKTLLKTAFLFACLAPLLVSGQISINLADTLPHESAMLDIGSHSLGFLVPRMTTVQRNNISGPTEGLLVYDNTTRSFWYYASGWMEIAAGNIDVISDADNDTKIQVEESADDDIIRFDAGGTEYFRMDAGRLEVFNTGSSVFMGDRAGEADDLTLNENVFIGEKAGLVNTSGINHVAVGYAALFQNTTGNYNVAIGRSALFSMQTGYYNVAVGRGAYNTGTAYNNSAALGDAVAVTGSNMVRIGDAGVTSIGGYANWSNISDSRFKTDVKENVAGLDFILRLRPVTYRLDPEKVAAFHQTPNEYRKPASEALKKAVVETGFIAQEVEQTAQDLRYDFSGVDAPLHDGDPYSLRYATFVVPLVKAIQEQQEMISDLKLQLEQQQRQIADLEKQQR